MKMGAKTSGLEKLKDIVIHYDENAYTFAANVVRLHNGELMVMFRKSKRRFIDGLGVPCHMDPTSKIYYLKSSDEGQTWPGEPTVVYGGQEENISADSTGLTVTRDGRVYSCFFRMRFYDIEQKDKIDRPLEELPVFGYCWENIGLAVMFSDDHGRTWEGPIQIETPEKTGRFGCPRGGIHELPDGNLLLPVGMRLKGYKQSGCGGRAAILISRDRGLNWKLHSEILEGDLKNGFSEPFLYRTDSGKLLAAMRTDAPPDDGYQYTAVSQDDGQTWSKPKKEQIWGMPHHMLKLRSGHVLCTYGYRHEPYGPYGIRARLLDAECQIIPEYDEIILRNEGCNWDLGYPYSVQLKDDSILIVYWINLQNEVRHIAASFVKLTG